MGSDDYHRCARPGGRVAMQPGGPINDFFFLHLGNIAGEQ
jgi:hypothetical protein